jgi:hypothetical protein
VVNEDGKLMRWYPPIDWLDYQDSKFLDDDVSLSQKYSTALYVGVLMISNNEMGPVNEIELFAATLFLLLSSILNA